MKKNILSLIFSALMASGFTTSSNAFSLEGLGIGASLGTGGWYAIGEEKTDNIPTGVDNTKQSGAFQHDIMSVFVEYTAGPIRIGVDYFVDDITTPENTNIQGSTTNTVKATFQNHTTAYIAMPIWGGLYAKVGGIYVDIKSEERLGTGGEYGNTDTTGYTAGLGFEKEIQNGVSIRGELMASTYEDVEVSNAKTTDISVKVTDMMGASGRVSLVKTF